MLYTIYKSFLLYLLSCLCYVSVTMEQSFKALVPIESLFTSILPMSCLWTWKRLTCSDQDRTELYLFRIILENKATFRGACSLTFFLKSLLFLFLFFWDKIKFDMQYLYGFLSSCVQGIYTNLFTWIVCMYLGLCKKKTPSDGLQYLSIVVSYPDNLTFHI